MHFPLNPLRFQIIFVFYRFANIIVGNAKVLCRQSLWNHLLHHYKDKRVLVEGPVSNMRESRVALPRLRRADGEHIYRLRMRLRKEF